MKKPFSHDVLVVISVDFWRREKRLVEASQMREPGSGGHVGLLWNHAVRVHKSLQ